MAKLRDVVAYLLVHYPYKSELSKARLTKLVYLADWRSAITRNKQITKIKWVYNHFGPYVNEVVNITKYDKAFTLNSSTNIFGNAKEVICASTEITYTSLNDKDKKVLDFVIKTTSSKYWDEFIKLIYSTYPIVTQPRFSELNLTQLAKQYKNEMAD